MNAKADPSPPQRDLPLGAMPTDNGTVFRVWAPHATAVSVKGDFNDWSDQSHPLAQGEAGIWSLHVDGVQAGASYKYRISNGKEAFDRIDPYARQVTNSVGVGIVHDPAFDWGDDDDSLPGHHELVIYEMHIGTFNTQDEERPGTFDEAVNRLDHLVRLGVNVVQIMPVAEFAGDYSWGYNPAHIFAVESAYGGPSAFKRLVREAHRRGLGVILDVVYNHFGPSDLDLWRFDGWSENDKGGIYFYNDHRSSTPWGDTRPDYGRTEVRGFIRDNAMMWLRDYHVDGLRWDMTLYIRSIGGGQGDELPDGWSLMQWVNAQVREAFPRALLICEDMRGLPEMVRDSAEGGAGFHAQWDASFVHPVRAAVIASDDNHRSMDAVRDAVQTVYEGDVFRRVVYSESHDEVANGKARIPQEVHGDDPTGWHAQKRSTLAAALVFTSPGIPMLFQGQEFLQGEWFRDDVPLDWEQRDDLRGIVRLYRDLARLRLDRGAQTRGLCGHGLHVFHVNDAMNLIAFHRWDAGGPGDDVVVVLNFSADERGQYALGLPAAGRWRVRFNGDSAHYSADFANFESPDVDAVESARDGLCASATLRVAPYSAIILSQDRSSGQTG